jgi:hypothetical protein
MRIITILLAATGVSSKDMSIVTKPGAISRHHAHHNPVKNADKSVFDQLFKGGPVTLPTPSTPYHTARFHPQTFSTIQEASNTNDYKHTMEVAFGQNKFSNKEKTEKKLTHTKEYQQGMKATVNLARETQRPPPANSDDKFLDELEKDLSFDQAKFFELFSESNSTAFKSADGKYFRHMESAIEGNVSAFFQDLVDTPHDIDEDASRLKNKMENYFSTLLVSVFVFMPDLPLFFY